MPLNSIVQQNAAFDKIFPELVLLVQQYIPSFFQGEVLDWLQSPQGRARVVKLINDGLTAAEAVEQ